MFQHTRAKELVFMVSGQLTPEESCPRLGLGFGSRSGLVLGLGDQTISPYENCPPILVRVWVRVSFGFWDQFSSRAIVLETVFIYIFSFLCVWREGAKRTKTNSCLLPLLRRTWFTYSSWTARLLFINYITIMYQIFFSSVSLEIGSSRNLRKIESGCWRSTFFLEE